MACSRCCFRLLVVLAVALLLSGCASKETVTVEVPATPPEDFTLDVLVLAGSDVPARGPVDQRPGRFVVRADGSLHYGSRDGGLPPRVRTLDQRDIDNLWALSGDLAMLEPELREPPRNPEIEGDPPRGMRYVVTFVSDSERWMRRYDRPEPRDAGKGEAAVRLVRALADYAWLSDEPTVRRITIPRRYDFGPNPYERYGPPLDYGTVVVTEVTEVIEEEEAPE
jgi:hypothetical protein